MQMQYYTSTEKVTISQNKFIIVCAILLDWENIIVINNIAYSKNIQNQLDLTLLIELANSVVFVSMDKSKSIHMHCVNRLNDNQWNLSKTDFTYLPTPYNDFWVELAL
jgi:hypothetical protein